MPKDVSERLDSGGTLGAAAVKQVAEFAKRIGSLLDQRDELNTDLKEVFNEARDAGLDAKILRKAIKRVRTDSETARTEEEMIEAYVHAIQPDLPFGNAA